MEDIEYVYTRGMSDSELTERLAGTNTGVLSLAIDGDAYAIPLAHHYEDDHLYLRLGLTEDSKKRRFIEETTTATYVVYEDSGSGGSWDPDSWSVIATGRIVELPATDEAEYDPAAINREFYALRVFDEAIDEIEIALFEFEIDSLTGRTTLGND